MPDDEPVDPWADAQTAQAERLAVLPPRAMLTRAEAMAKADAFLRAAGSQDVAVTATPNPLQGLWIVGHRNPQRPDDLIVGGGPLIVPTIGPAYEANGSIPPWPEEVGMEEPESWRFENGEELLPEDWRQRLEGELSQGYWHELLSFVAEERQTNDVFPPPSQTFAAFELTSYDDIRVVILGQDPYPQPRQANGLCFSVPNGVPKPKSLTSIHAAMRFDRIMPPEHGDLTAWAQQGVMLLNTALTVRFADPGSHAKEWREFTDAVIRLLNSREEPLVFVLWGRAAQRKKRLIDTDKHAVIEAPHPAARGKAQVRFRESKTFSEVNRMLRKFEQDPIEWAIPSAKSIVGTDARS